MAVNETHTRLGFFIRVDVDTRTEKSIRRMDPGHGLIRYNKRQPTARYTLRCGVDEKIRFIKKNTRLRRLFLNE